MSSGKDLRSILLSATLSTNLHIHVCRDGTPVYVFGKVVGSSHKSYGLGAASRRLFASKQAVLEEHLR